ncbi:hypothetical protein REPUB_Repub03eG0226100 [Reevesia pubescens]
MDKSCLKNQWIIQIKFLLFIVLLITLLSISFKPALALGNEIDRLALLALKDQVVGGSPGALNSWNDSLNFCHWQGVRCGRRHQRVSTLNLVGLKLSGSISPLIGNLTFLREVDFSDNKLKGNIPVELGHLRRLRYLNLSVNHLQGQLPVELTNCSYLQVLILRYNNLTGEIPFNLGSMKNLTQFSLGVNNLFGTIPSSFGNLSSLNFLVLSDNYFEGIIPSALGRVSNLEVLGLSANKLSGTIPPAIYNISSLIALSLTSNQFSGRLATEFGLAFPKLEIFYVGNNQFTGMIPRSVSNISSLQYFDIGLNNFFGSVPNNLGNMKNLQALTIDYNNLGSGKAGDLSFISSLSNCSQLQELAMHVNRFGGAFPDSIANLSTELRRLYMGGNQVFGRIPEGIGNLVNLYNFDMGLNFLTGNIPNSIGKLQNLEGLHLPANSLSGKISSAIGNLTRLSRLDLSNNTFRGRIPLSLRKCKSMQNLDLSQNKLIGTIPDQLFSALESLISLNLSHNSFTGLLPSDIGSSKNLVELYVYNNNFSGEIPKELGESSALTTLCMQGNSFKGSIPQSFGNLKALEKLDLADNNLSGVIPRELAKLSFLVSLNLSFNQLEGEVPKEGVFKNVSGFSITGNRKLCGGILEFELPKCFNNSEKKGNSLSTKVIIIMILSLLVASILVVLFVTFIWRRKSKGELVPGALLGHSYLRVSYKELLQATDGFASANLIGAGSFGSVYRGNLLQLENPVAVKVLNLQNRGATKSFIAECEALGKVRHRNLLKIITSCSSSDYQGNDFKALVFDFMPNGSLESWLHTQLESRYLNFVQRLDIAIDVGNALEYLHHHCETVIVHCDMKPTNVLLDADMVAHVSDFGLAKLLYSATGNLVIDQTNSSMIKGTIGYVAPEYGMGVSVSSEGDIYSFGILLLEMITGKRPTDDLFHDGLSLHNFCNMGLPENLKEILDFRLLQQMDENRQRIRSQQNMEEETWECLVSFVKIGIACSAVVPGERMRIEDAVSELHAVKERLNRIRTGINTREIRQAA